MHHQIGAAVRTFRRIHLSVPTDLLTKVDTLAAAMHQDRSEVIRNALVKMTANLDRAPRDGYAAPPGSRSPSRN